MEVGPGPDLLRRRLLGRQVRGRAERRARRPGAAAALDGVAADRVLAAAHITARHPIAFAGRLAAAAAAARDATLLTGDPDVRERDIGCRTPTRARAEASS